ncbi:zinc finger, CCHC-type containing protein [Tanacetum coccineum]
MADAAMKHMASNFAKLDKFKGVDFRRWQKKMHFLLYSMSVVMLNLPKNYENPWRPNIWLRMHQVRSSLFTQHKMNMDESIQVSCIIDKLPPFWKDFKHTLKHLKEELTLIELGSHLRIEVSLKVHDSDKPKGNIVAGPLVVNMVEHNNSSRNMTKLVTLKGIAKVLMLATKLMLQAQRVRWMDDDVAWWVDLGATIHVCKNRYWFKTYESLNDGSILNMGNESTTLVHGRGCVDLRLNIVNDNIASAFISTSKLNDSILWHARLGHVRFKRMQDMSKDGLIPAFDMDTEKWNKKYFVTFIDDASRFCYVYLLHTKDEALDKFKVFKTEVELQQGSLIKRFRTDKEGLSQGFWDEAMAVVRLPDPKLKTLGKRSIECIFVGYAEHSEAFRFYGIEPNDLVLINSIIESRDAFFDDNGISSVPRPSLRIPNRTEDIGGSVVPEEVTEKIV